MHFIGDVPRSRLGLFAERLHEPFAPLALALTTPQHWPHGLVVLRAQEVPPALQALHQRLGLALQSLDVPLDARPYSPHVSLARRAQLATPPASTDTITWPVYEYALVESTGRADQRYTILRRYPATDRKPGA